jgi:hypothetical protein
MANGECKIKVKEYKMFEISVTNPTQMFPAEQNESNPNLRNKMGAYYTRYARKGMIKRIFRMLQKKSVRMIDLNSFLKGKQVMSSSHMGIRSVEIDRIQGSEGRSSDFDLTFHPIQEHTRHRWLSVAVARLSGKALPPIELVQVKDIFFVRDGHHRISVARAFGEKFMDAIVTKLELRDLQTHE